MSEDKIKNLKVEVTSLIECAFVDIDREIESHKLYNKGYLTEEILLKIKVQLTNMKNTLSNSSFPPNYDYIIRDWGQYGVPLGTKLLDIILKYRKLP